MNPCFFPKPISFRCNSCPYNIPCTKEYNKYYENGDFHRSVQEEQEISNANQLTNKVQSKEITSVYPEAVTKGNANNDMEAYKDDFIQGFVPNHNHGSVDYTSISEGHVHQCLDVTFPPTPSEGNTHIHQTEGYVLFEDGHNHYYKANSGPAIPVGNGMHVHYYDFYTTVNDGHKHRIRGVDMPAPGTK